MKVRLIDCVGYMVDGATGHMEEDVERMVKTPWSTEEITFTQAAQIGTRKVIQDHSTIGIVVTTDGQFWGTAKRSLPQGRRTDNHRIATYRKAFCSIGQYLQALQ